jgi:signal transduction histidine kinase
MATRSDHNDRLLSRIIALSQSAVRQDGASFLQSVANAATELTGSAYSILLVYDPVDEVLKFAAGPQPELPGLQKLTLPLSGSFAGLTFQRGEIIHLESGENNPPLTTQVGEIMGEPVNRLLSVPIRYRENRLGVIQAVNKHTHPYFPEDTVLLESLAALAGTCLFIQQLETKRNGLSNEIQAFEERKTNFAAITSHELRTPLGVILGNATFLREMMQNPELLPQVEAIILSGLRLKETIETLTRADKLHSGTARLHLAPVQLQTLLQDLVTSYQPEARNKRINMSLTLPETLLVVNAEEDKLGIATQNLIRNALTFTEPGGAVSISLRSLPGYAQLSISDTGIGIPLEHQQAIFDRFFQVESHLTRKHGGMGLGLPVARAIVELHGGEIWVKSQPGTGSTFSFILPLAPGDNGEEQDVRNEHIPTDSASAVQACDASAME